MLVLPVAHNRRLPRRPVRADPCGSDSHIEKGVDMTHELTASERDELHRLRQEADELRGEVEIQREILRKTAAWLAQEMQEGRGDDAGH
jgi:CHAD domain-containing protein